MNVRDDLMNDVKLAGKEIVAMHITVRGFSISSGCCGDAAAVIALRKGYTSTEFNQALNALNFEYDDYKYDDEIMFDDDVLEGIVWLTDGAWLERYEYDGWYSWQIRKPPKLEDYFKVVAND